MLDEGIEKRSEFVPFSSKMGQEPNLQTGSGQNVPAPAGSGPQHCKYIQTKYPVWLYISYSGYLVLISGFQMSPDIRQISTPYLSGASLVIYKNYSKTVYTNSIPI